MKHQIALGEISFNLRHFDIQKESLLIAERPLHGCCTALHCSALFIFRAGDHRDCKLRKPEPTRCFPLPKRIARISPRWASLSIRRRRKDRNSAAFSASTNGSAQSFPCCRHAIRFFRIQFHPAHEEIVRPGSLRDPPQSENQVWPDQCRSSSQLGLCGKEVKHGLCDTDLTRLLHSTKTDVHGFIVGGTTCGKSKNVACVGVPDREYCTETCAQRPKRWRSLGKL